MPRHCRFLALILLFFYLPPLLVLGACGRPAAPEALPRPALLADVDPDADVVFSIAHGEGPDSALQQALENFSQTVWLESRGRLKIELYPDNCLGGPETQLQLAAQGLAGAVLLTPAQIAFALSAENLPDPGWLSLLPPFAYLSPEEAMAAALGSRGQALNQDLGSLGLLSLGWLYGRERVLAAASQPLASPQDFQGLCFAVDEEIQPLLSPMFSALGAESRATLFWRLPQDLDEEILDGGEGPLARFWQEKDANRLPYLSLLGHSYDLLNLLVNEAGFMALDETCREAFLAALPALIKDQRELAAAEEARMLEDLNAAGVQVFLAGASLREEFRDYVLAP